MLFTVGSKLGFANTVHTITVSDGTTPLEHSGFAISAQLQAYTTDEEVLGRLDYQATSQRPVFPSLLLPILPSLLGSGTIQPVAWSTSQQGPTLSARTGRTPSDPVSSTNFVTASSSLPSTSMAEAFPTARFRTFATARQLCVLVPLQPSHYRRLGATISSVPSV